MRVTFLTTLAAAALSLSFAATAEASGTATTTTTTTGTSTGGGTSVTLTTEQRTKAVETLKGVSVQPVQGDVNIAVGQPVPQSVTTLVDCPQTLTSLITGVQNCKVIRAGNQYYIVEGGSRRVVTTIPAQ